MTDYCVSGSCEPKSNEEPICSSMALVSSADVVGSMTEDDISHHGSDVVDVVEVSVVVVGVVIHHS